MLQIYFVSLFYTKQRLASMMCLYRKEALLRFLLRYRFAVKLQICCFSLRSL